MAQVLLYNINDAEKLRRIRVVLLRLGIRERTVRYEEYAHPLGYLAGAEGYTAALPHTGEEIGEEMMVMAGLNSRQFSARLDTLRASRAVVSLKAVLTETNAAWDSIALYKALREERSTMRELQERKRK